MIALLLALVPHLRGSRYCRPKRVCSRVATWVTALDAEILAAMYDASVMNDGIGSAR
jgi:hypothetical protein